MLVIALCAWSVQAQSGRRNAKPAPAAPVPTPTPEATPSPKKAEKEPELLIFLGVDRHDSFSSLPFSFYDAVLRGCADRLRASSAGIEITDKSLSRGEAIKKAKSDAGSYVVLLTLKFDTLARSYDDLILEFVVFAPGDAKVVTTGRSYPAGNRAGPIIAGPTRGRTSVLYQERLLVQAGEDAGNRILKALHLNVDVPKGP